MKPLGFIIMSCSTAVFRERRRLGTSTGADFRPQSCDGEEHSSSPLHCGAEPLTDGEDGRGRCLAYPSECLLNTLWIFYFGIFFFFSDAGGSCLIGASTAREAAR